MGESNKYAIVEFPNDQVNGRPLVQEVPMHWITNDKTKCWWPPKNVSKEIKNYGSPTETWKLYPIVLLKICDNLSDAWFKCIRSSDGEQNEEMGKHMRKKKETFRHMFRDSSYSPPPAPNSVVNGETSHCTDIANMFTNGVSRTEYVADGLANKSIRNIGSNYETDISNDYDARNAIELLEMQNEYMSGSGCKSKRNGNEYVPAGVYNRGDGNTRTSNEYCGSLGGSGKGSTHSYTTLLPNYVPTPIPKTISSADAEELRNSITTLTMEIKKIGKIIMESSLKIINIEEILMDRNKTTSEAAREFKNLFPIKSKEGLNKLNEELLVDSAQVESLKFFLLGIGGLGPKDHHARMMKTLLTNELGMLCSWKGLRGNMKLQNLKLFDVCCDVLKSQWNVTEKEFELFTQDFVAPLRTKKKT